MSQTAKLPEQTAPTIVTQTMMKALRGKLQRVLKVLRPWRKAPEQKERKRREKRMGEKKAKKIRRKVSLPGYLGTGGALLGACSGRKPAEGRVVAERWLAGTFLMGLGIC